MTDQASFEDRLRKQIEAYHEAALVYAAVKLGLPDRLAAGPATAEQLASALGLSAPHLHRFLRGLSGIGICEELPDDTFALAGGGECLRSGSPSRLAEKVQIVVGQYWWPWANVVSNLKTGKPAFEQSFGMRVSDWRTKHAEQGALFDSYLAKETLAQAGPIVIALDLSGTKCLADIGGGYGGLLAALLNAHPDIEAILFDRPQTIEAAKPFLASLGVAARVTFEAGDFLAAIPVQADLYLLKGVLQQWDDAEALTILRNCRAAMPDGAKLAIIERLLPARAADDPAAIMLDLHMMTITGGRARSLAEFTKLLSETGFALSKVAPTGAGLSILEAAPE
ncbi:MAG: methyltransferase [Methyloceanibacter sp.]